MLDSYWVTQRAIKQAQRQGEMPKCTLKPGSDSDRLRLSPSCCSCCSPTPCYQWASLKVVARTPAIIVFALFPVQPAPPAETSFASLILCSGGHVGRTWGWPSVARSAVYPLVSKGGGKMSSCHFHGSQGTQLCLWPALKTRGLLGQGVASEAGQLSRVTSI